MFVLIFNTVGLLTCFVPAVVLFLIWGGLPSNDVEVWALTGPWGAVVFLVDVWWRVVHRDAPWYSPRRGGRLFFVPVCLLG
jgi:hypothetical protein